MTIPDANFQAVIEEAWLNPNGTPITEVEMFALTELSVPGADIRDLTRLEFTLNLTFFGLTVQRMISGTSRHWQDLPDYTFSEGFAGTCGDQSYDILSVTRITTCGSNFVPM